MGKKKSSKKTSGKSTNTNVNVGTDNNVQNLNRNETTPVVTDGPTTDDIVLEDDTTEASVPIKESSNLDKNENDESISAAEDTSQVEPTDSLDNPDKEKDTIPSTDSSVINDENVVAETESAPSGEDSKCSSSIMESSQDGVKISMPMDTDKVPVSASLCDEVVEQSVSISAATGDEETISSVDNDQSRHHLVSDNVVADEEVKTITVIKESPEDGEKISTPIDTEELQVSVRVYDEVVDQLVSISVGMVEESNFLLEGNDQDGVSSDLATDEVSTTAETTQPYLTTEVDDPAEPAVVDTVEIPIETENGETACEKPVELEPTATEEEVLKRSCDEPSSNTMIVEDLASSSFEVVQGTEHVIIDESRGKETLPISESVKPPTSTINHQTQDEKSLLTLFTVMVEDAVTSCQEIFSSDENTSNPTSEVQKVPVNNNMTNESQSNKVETLGETNENKPVQARKPIQAESLSTMKNEAAPKQAFYTLDQLMKPMEGVDWAKREDYLSDDDFKKCLTVTRETFSTLPAWKKKALKQKARIF